MAKPQKAKSTSADIFFIVSPFQNGLSPPQFFVVDLGIRNELTGFITKLIQRGLTLYAPISQD
jgi:hypothetical protein